jgi:starch synthase (maltosyl-transferring)
VQPSAVLTASHDLAVLEESRRRVAIERIRPEIDGGRFPVKRTAGETVEVSADIFADGHDVIVAVLCDRRAPVEPAGAAGTVRGRRPEAEDAPSRPDAGTREQAGYRAAGREPTEREADEGGWRETPMMPTGPGSDRWSARFEVTELGWHEYRLVAWVDRFRTWRRALELKAAALQDVSNELFEASVLVREAAERAHSSTDRRWLVDRADALTGNTSIDNRIALALDGQLMLVMPGLADRSRATTSPARRVWVDRERARFGAWYEMFPRSAGSRPDVSATFREAVLALPRIADLGFDVLYLPPIHPIGTSFRRGANNAPVAGPGDPGSPWAIGSAEGGHTAVEPGLGTLQDFDAFRREAQRLGLEVALDLAWQCSPDHPWVRDHPEWFRHRRDGTIHYAENPPKKYPDIYPLDFENEDWRSLWQALLEVARFWISRGVRIFRVDNPHTKPFRFWEWFIDRIHADHPDVIFLSEAFTRPVPMRHLAKLGFTQSYTHFTWKNTKAELTEYFTELTSTEVREYFRPNLFANTPDILHAFLQAGGRPAFEARLLLAATLGASYGIYSGFELCDARALAPGSEEYADSEKYQLRHRDWNSPGNLNELLRRINGIRRGHPALHADWSLRFHATDNPEIIAYSKMSREESDRLFMIVNLDPRNMQHGFVEAPFDADHYNLRDLLDETSYTWHRGWNYVRFEPGIRQGHVMRVEWRA